MAGRVARSCVQTALKTVNSVLGLAGMAVILYALWMLRAWSRQVAVDLLGFGRSPKPADSLYTLREHVEMIERSVLQRYRLRSFHVVAHSLGSVLPLLYSRVLTHLLPPGPTAHQ